MQEGRQYPLHQHVHLEAFSEGICSYNYIDTSLGVSSIGLWVSMHGLGVLLWLIRFQIFFLKKLFLNKNTPRQVNK